MKTFAERWENGKLVRGEEAAAPAPLPKAGEAFLRAMYPDTIHGDDEPPRGYHTAHVDNAPKTKRLPFQRADATSIMDLIPGAQ